MAVGYVRPAARGINPFKSKVQIANEIVARRIVERLEGWVVDRPSDWRRLLICEIASALDVAGVRQ